MIRKFLATAVMVIAFVAFGFSQDVTGDWKRMVMEQFEVSYTFKVEGEKLTGSSKGPDGTEMKISNGVIKGEDLSFSIDIMGNPTKINGKIKPNATDKTKAETVTLTFAVNGNDVSLLLAKVK